MKAYVRVDIYTQVFLTSALDGDQWSASLPDPFIPGERAPGTHWIGAWVGPRAGLDDMEKDQYGRKLNSLQNIIYTPPIPNPV
jgi:hypothetical protein